MAALAVDDDGIAPLRHRQRLAVDRHDLERIGVDMKDVVVMLMRVDDRPLLDRTELDPLIDAVRIELLAIDEKTEFLPMAGSIRLRRPARTTASTFSSIALSTARTGTFASSATSRAENPSAMIITP